MNSMDTPLGTLNKQLKKQESMQTPYIILSGSGRDTGFVLYYSFILFLYFFSLSCFLEIVFRMI